jgi:hypothetical protein
MEGMPPHVSDAFGMLLYANPTRRARFADRFLRTWGGFDPPNLARALHEGEGADRLFALLALDGLDRAESNDTLIPFLRSTEPLERWASAIGLGRKRLEPAIPVLIAMLTEFLPPDAEYQQSWLYWNWRPLIPGLLADWGRRDAIGPLRQALQAVLRIELEVPEPPAGSTRVSDREDWRQYEDRIVYALGRLGALGALTGLEHAEARLEIWRVHLVMGYLHGRYKITRVRLWEAHPDLHAEVSRILDHCFGLTVQERERSLEAYDVEKSFEVMQLSQTAPPEGS